MTGLFLYLLVINLLGLSVMYVDKNRARKRQYRISERTLWLIALIGGAVGSTCGMLFFRHKTKHLIFKIGQPLLAIIDAALLFYALA